MPAASFDHWTILFLFFALLALLLSIFFFIHRTPARFANLMLGVYLVLYGIMMIEYVLFWTGYIEQLKWLAGVSLCFPFLLGPLLLLHLQAAYTGKPPAGRRWQHVYPFAILFVATMLLLKWPALRRQFMPDDSIVVFDEVMAWFGIVHMCVYGFQCYHYIHAQGHSKLVSEWGWWMLFFFGLFILGQVAYYVLIHFSFFSSQWDYFISIIISAAILCSAWFGYAHSAIFQGYSLRQAILSPTIMPNYAAEQPVNDVAGPKYQHTGLTPAAAQKLADKLSDLMQQEKLYLDNAISLDKLCERLNASRHHVSQVINQFQQASFFEYINRLRIAEAQRLLLTKTKEELNAIEIAYLVGFNNKVSFINAFKKQTGCTPTQYRQQKG
jgi:AraC-like DNA-binding protein